MKRGSLKNKRKPTGELDLFREIFAERSGKCEITDTQLVFDPWCFAHILSKGAYPKFRLVKENIVLCTREFHTSFDTMGEKKTLDKWPQSKWVYEKKDVLKEKYFSSKDGV